MVLDPVGNLSTKRSKTSAESAQVWSSAMSKELSRSTWEGDPGVCSRTTVRPRRFHEFPTARGYQPWAPPAALERAITDSCPRTATSSACGAVRRESREHPGAMEAAIRSMEMQVAVRGMEASRGAEPRMQVQKAYPARASTGPAKLD